MNVHEVSVVVSPGGGNKAILVQAYKMQQLLTYTVHCPTSAVILRLSFHICLYGTAIAEYWMQAKK